MNINIHGNKIEVTPAIETYIKDKFSTVHTPEKLLQVDFKVGVDKNNQYVQFDAQVMKEHVHIKELNENLYAAIDEIMDKIKLKFKKMKEKPIADRHEKISNF